MILAMPQGSTINDLERVIEESTKLPTTGMGPASAQHGLVDPSHGIFIYVTSIELQLMPTFTLDEVITVSVKSLTGQMIVMRLQLEKTILRIKEYIREMEGIPVDQAKLIYDVKMQRC